MIRFFRQHLNAKLFLSYLVVIIVCLIVLGTAAERLIPAAFNRHLSAISTDGAGLAREEFEQNLHLGFRAGVLETLGIAALAALLVSVVTSLLVSPQVGAPILRILQASHRIADGHYEERILLPGSFDLYAQDELAQLAISFNRMASSLEETETMRRQLIGDISHELRTPLAVIKGSIEGLIDGVLPPSDETFEQIYWEASRLGRLVDDLQELSRVEAGVFELNPKPIPVTQLVEATSARLGGQYREKGVDLAIDLPSGLPLVFADEDRIGQVLTNLLGNALQYTPTGGRVRVSALQQDGEVQVSVSDTGIGIAGEHLPHLFTRFYRVDISRSRIQGGSGIGLTIARHLVEAHGGRIWAASPGIGKGSTFAFTLKVGG
jgi:histidine kinase